MKGRLTWIYRTGVLCIILCFALGIANLINLNLIIIFSAICLCVHQLLKVCSLVADFLLEHVPSFSSSLKYPCFSEFALHRPSSIHLSVVSRPTTFVPEFTSQWQSFNG